MNVNEFFGNILTMTLNEKSRRKNATAYIVLIFL